MSAGAILQDCGNLHGLDLLCAPQDNEWFLVGSATRDHVNPYLLPTGTKIKLTTDAAERVALGLRRPPQEIQQIHGVLGHVDRDSGRLTVQWLS
jgi:hypothetical protein